MRVIVGWQGEYFFPSWLITELRNYLHENCFRDIKAPFAVACCRREAEGAAVFIQSGIAGECG